MTRIFNAPPERVFEAMVNPHHIPEWWGPRKMTTIIEQADVREGGRWWFTQHNRQGDVHTFYGEYRELTYPDRLVQTVNVEGLPEDHEVVETITFEPRLGGRSLVTARSVYKSVRDRDYELAAGGEKNAVESWDRLDKFLWRTREAKAA